MVRLRFKAFKKKAGEDYLGLLLDAWQRDMLAINQCTYPTYPQEVADARSALEDKINEAIEEAEQSLTNGNYNSFPEKIKNPDLFVNWGD